MYKPMPVHQTRSMVLRKQFCLSNRNQLKSSIQMTSESSLDQLEDIGKQVRGSKVPPCFHNVTEHNPKKLSSEMGLTHCFVMLL